MGILSKDEILKEIKNEKSIHFLIKYILESEKEDYDEINASLARVGKL